jgi:hypothetical protein
MYLKLRFISNCKWGFTRLQYRYNTTNKCTSDIHNTLIKCTPNTHIIQNTNKTKTNSVALSPQANYTDWATATCQRNLVPIFVDRWVLRGQRGGSPTVVNLSFLDRSRYFSSKYLLIYPHKGWMDPVPGPLQLRKSGSAGNRTRDLWVSSQKLWPPDHRDGHII